MASKALKTIRILLILALLLAAAVTPSLADAKSKKPAKRMKISFDSNEAATPAGEPLRPRATDRSYDTPGETVRLRAQNIDDIWAANGGGVKTESRRSSKAVAARPVLAKRVALAAKPVPAKKPTALPAKKSTSVAHIEPLREQDEIDFVEMTRKARETRRTFKVAKQEPQKPLRVEQKVVHIPEEQPRPYLSERVVVRERESSSFDLKFAGEFNSNFSFGTSQTLDIEGQKNSIFINEVVLGVKDKSGWGALASGSFNAVSNADSNYDVREIGDASLIALHPDFYKDDSLRVSGFFRYFAPMSQTSKEVGLHHSSYALNLDGKLANGFDFKNSLIGRYFWQTFFYEGDATLMIQDLTEVTKKLTPEFSLGVGQQTRIEMHYESASGTRIELIPLARYKVLSKVSLEAKAFLPLVKSGIVGLAPLAAAVPNPTAMFSAHIEF